MYTNYSTEKDDAVKIMVLSSSTSSNFGGRKKCEMPEDEEDEMLDDQKGNPLRGIERDKKRFQKRHPNSTVIESSQDKKALLSRNYIINIFSNEFSRSNIYFFYLFYSGHGHTNGDLAPETTENPQADRISLKQLAGLWAKRKQKTAKLFIFMDSCYSGNWCLQMKYLANSNNIAIFASSQYNQPSIDSLGGVFLTTILDPQENFAANYAKLIKHQKPVFFCSNGQVSPLTQNHLKSLNQKIQNANTIYQKSSNQNGTPIQQVYFNQPINRHINFNQHQQRPQYNTPIPPVGNNSSSQPAWNAFQTPYIQQVTFQISQPQTTFQQRMQRQNQLLETCRRQAAKIEQTQTQMQRLLLQNCQRQAEKEQQSREQYQNLLLEWCKRQANKY